MNYETGIQRAILNRLATIEAAGTGYFTRVNSYAGPILRRNRPNSPLGFVKNNKKGCPDIIGVYRGTFVAIEVKGPRTKQTPEQKDAEETITKAGGIYILARSVKDVTDKLDQLFLHTHPQES